MHDLLLQYSNNLLLQCSNFAGLSFISFHCQGLYVFLFYAVLKTETRGCCCSYSCPDTAPPAGLLIYNIYKIIRFLNLVNLNASIPHVTGYSKELQYSIVCAFYSLNLFNRLQPKHSVITKPMPERLNSAAYVRENLNVSSFSKWTSLNNS